MIKVSTPTCHPTTEERIQHFTTFKPGWHYGEGCAFDPLIIEDAIKINAEAKRLGFETDAHPGIGGAIMVTVFSRNCSLELIVEYDRSVSLTRETGDDEMEHEELLTLLETLVKVGELVAREELKPQ